MPFSEGGVDVVTAFNSVLYAADPRRALSACDRAFRNGRRDGSVSPEQADSAALIDPLAHHDDVPDRNTLDLADAEATRGALARCRVRIRSDGRHRVRRRLRERERRGRR
ncbi:hypothetical protein [Micromonospora globbae]|uniref:hypothetical protein n=1 Tax=Micromonospora globbae TaxID=1894969 RepID=UPI00342941AF